MTFQSTQDRLSSYCPGLDGLRAVSIIWVILHNGLYDKLIENNSIAEKVLSFVSDSGWLGVQLFFVLSGFLISGILIDAKKYSKSLVFRNFYARRVLRIFPIYYTFIFLLITAAIILPIKPPWLQAAYEYKWWHLSYLANWVQPYRDVGVGHLWSLAVEEQYYVMWPLVVLLCSTRKLYWISLAVIALAVVFRSVVVESGFGLPSVSAYVMTPARLDALAIGGLLALALRDQIFYKQLGRFIGVITLMSGLCMVGVVLVQHSFEKVSTGVTVLNQTIAAFFFAGIIFYVFKSPEYNGKLKIITNLLEMSWVRRIGKYSYAMYIFHLPISLILHSYVTALVIRFSISASSVISALIVFLDLFLLICSTYLFAWLSWNIIEKRFLYYKKYFPMHNADKLQP